MAVNPFQTVAEMSFGQYDTKKSGAVRSPQANTSLSGQGHKGARGFAPGYTEATLSEPRAGGSMPQGNADIKRPNYGQQQSQEPQRQSRKMSFGGMGAGATKGGGSGMTAGGDIKFDLSIGKTDNRNANFSNARVGQLGGMGNTQADNNQSDTDASVTDNSKRTLNMKTGNPTAKTKTKTPAGTPPRAKKTPAPGEKTPDLTELRTGKPGKKTPATKEPGTEASAPSSRSTASSRSTSGAASIRDIGEGFMSGGSKLTGATVNVGRNRVDSDNVSRRTKSTKTDVRASGSATASADSKDARKVAPAKSKKEKTAEPTLTSTPKEDPKAEAIGKETVKEKAKKAVAKSATKIAAKATKSTATDKKVKAVKTAAKEEEEE